jgi:hypothetical protein
MKGKDGIALLITVIMLAALSALILKSYTLSEKYLKDNDDIRLTAQSNRLYLDSKKILKQTLRDINSTEEYAFIFGQSFSIPSANFDITFMFRPIDNKININNILVNSKINKNIYDLLENLLISYNVVDSSFFLDLLLDTIDKDSKERTYESEIINQNIYFTNGKIYSKKHLSQIIDYYAQNRDDKNIYKIPWDKYINFNSINIDINFVSIDLLKLLLPSENINKTFKDKYYKNYKDLGISKVSKDMLKKLNIVFTTSRVSSKIKYNNSDKKFQINYIYDVNNNKTIDVKYNF